MNSILSGSAWSPERDSHSRIKSNPVRTRLEDILWDGPHPKITPSSTNIFRPHLDQVELISLRRGDVNRADKMGERGEPCGMP